MAADNTAHYGTAFTVSIEARHGVTTGISAADRATTIRAAIAPDARPDDLVRPGHIFPLGGAGGVLRRAGQTEGSVDLARLAGLHAGRRDLRDHERRRHDGAPARPAQFGRKHGLKIVTVADLIRYRRTNESLIRRAARGGAPNGPLRRVPRDRVRERRRLRPARRAGDGRVRPEGPVLVRVHSECLTGDVFGSLRCDCGEQLAARPGDDRRGGRGVILYMRQEGRGIGLLNKLRAYELQDQGWTRSRPTCARLQADLRDYGIGAQILADWACARSG